MFVLFTPFSFFFVTIYFMFLYFAVYLSDFYVFWVFMECSMLIFIGLAYSTMSFGYVNLLVYFIIQSLASINILVFYSLDLYSLVFIFLILKLAIFPFFFWYLLVISKLSNVLFFICSTFHNIPPMYIFSYFFYYYNLYLLWFILVLTVFVAGAVMYSTSNIRFLIVFSSVANNSWFVLSSVFSFDFFLFFLFMYCLNFYLLLSFFSGLFNISLFSSFSSSLVFMFLLLSIAGFPPFPMFFTNLYIVFLITSSLFYNLFLLILFLLSVVLMLASYVRWVLFSILNFYGSRFSILVL